MKDRKPSRKLRTLAKLYKMALKILGCCCASLAVPLGSVAVAGIGCMPDVRELMGEVDKMNGCAMTMD